MSKVLYRDQYQAIVYYRNGKKFTDTIIQFNMKYGEMPGEEIEMFSRENIGQFVTSFGHWVDEETWCGIHYMGINGNQAHRVKNIDRIEVIRSQAEISPSTRITELTRELGYKEYMQFVYDTEKELRSIVAMPE